MGFERHRTRNAETIQQPIIVKKDIVPEIIETIKEVFPDAKVEEIKPKIKTEPIKKAPAKKPPRKKREDKKEYTNIGIIGNTIVCKDFRAIVKKKGEQINNVLTEILHEYNTKNYSVL